MILVAIALVIGLGLPLSSFSQHANLDSLKHALEVPQTDIAQAQTLRDIAWELYWVGGESPKPYLLKALQISNRIHDARGLAEGYVQLGAFERQNAHYEKAESLYAAALDIRENLRDTSGIASVYNNLGDVKSDQGDYLSAQSNYEKAYKIALEHRNYSFVALLSVQLCKLHKILGNFTRSIEFGQMALKILEAEEFQDSTQIGKACAALGNTYERMGQAGRAKDYYFAAKKCFEAGEETGELSSILLSLGNLDEYNSNYDAALDYYNQSYALRRTLFDTLNAAITLRNIARIHERQGNFAQSEQTLHQGIGLLKGTEDQAMSTVMEADLAVLMLWQNRPAEAARALEGLLPKLDSLAEITQKIDYRYLLSIAKAGENDIEGARKHVMDALNMRQAMDQDLNSGLYLYDRYLQTSKENLRIKAESELLERDKQIQEERNRQYVVIIISLTIALLLIVLLALQRIQLLKNKRNTAEHKLMLEMKQREVERMEQSKKLEILKVTLEVEDRERSRIAQDLHDHVGAQIGAFKHLVGQLRDDVGSGSPTFTQSFEKLNLELEVLMAEVRHIAYDLESPTLKTFGLVAALKGFKDLFANSKQLDVELDIHGMEDRLDSRMEKQIYLIIKELFSNAINRGKATQFSIQLLRVEKQLTIVVEDNGSGFDTKVQKANPGLGLKGIENRVQSMDGTLLIDSAIGRGTIVTIEIPL